jgi:2-polyprenyl-3-methyl-5-hydroxy-6-metoxy-1,4-benzoquinol methylase
MSERYFATARTEIAPYLPQRVSRLLDIGCGTGATTSFVKSLRDVQWAGGAEFVPEEAEKARSVCDLVHIGNVEEWAFEKEIEPGSLDLILCLDVLEHLVDPWRVVRRLSPLLAPGGRLIVSVPNIRNWKFIRGLLFRGDFHYRDSGLLDRTHLRFFVRDTARDLALSGGLKLHFCGNAHPWVGSDARRILSNVTGGRLDDLMIKQFLIVAEA